MQRKTNIQRLSALLMAMLMLLSAFPMNVFAENIGITDSAFTTDVYAPTESIPEADESPVGEETNSDETTEETPPSKDVPTEEDSTLTEEPSSPEAEDELVYDDPPTLGSLESAIAANGHAYGVTIAAANVYSAPDKAELIFNIPRDGAVLLATAYDQSNASIKVWFITSDNEVMTGYVDVADLGDAPVTDDEAYTMAETLPSAWVSSDAGELLAYVVEGEQAATTSEQPTQEPVIQEPAPTDVPENDTPQELPADETEQPTQTDEPSLKDVPMPEETPAEEPILVQAGDFIAVSTSTSVFSDIDETASDDYEGDLYMGVFVSNATVQVDAVEQDTFGRYWYRVRYLFGDDFADGTLKWTDTDTVYMLANETNISMEQELTVTDYAYPYAPPTLFSFGSPMNGFSLKTINARIPTFYVGQNGVYGSSGKDSDYLQIAKSADHGTIYATPHYLDGFTVYCLEHNLSGPGENISGGGQQPTGPYMIVDIDSYRNNPGYSSIIYHDSTMHAIAWVLRHTYPFMALDRSDSDNEVWSRVAGQFAIRQVIREMEGAQYVRSYWNMDNFYRASGQAPAVYLEYARWLAANGIARGNITGNINASGKSTTASGGGYVGSVTLTTDADRMRISRSVGNLSGNTAGQDSSYYYLNSGDTISVASSAKSFSITVESVSSEDEEASFLVGVPSVEIQKVLIPQYGTPYKLKSLSVTFDVPVGSISVTKKDTQTGVTLSGATFELLNAAGSILQTQTTGSNGVATFANLQPGAYTVREKSATQGYTVSITNTQNVTVTAGTVSTAAFTNDVMTAKIRIVKKDQQTKEPLAGVEFTVTRLSAPAGRNGIGEVVAVLTTDANGAAETGWLDWGRYRITETKVPPHFMDNHFSTEIDAFENGKTYELVVENEPTKGWIRLTKTDRQNGNPIAGVQFDIYYSDEYGNGLAATMVTGADGVAVSAPLRKGRYIVKEHGQTSGYVFEEVTLDATVKSDETTELTATNQPVQVRLKLYKRDADEYDGDNPNATAKAKENATLPTPANISAPTTRGDGILTGAEFQVLAGADITDRQGNVVYHKGDIVIASLKTAGEDASVTTDSLWPGLYEIIEITPPTSYHPSDKSFFVDARSAATQSVEVVVTYEGLKTNEIMTGLYAIVKFLGDNEVHDDAGIVETPEVGAEFEVYLKSAGSYENARAFERDYLTTNKYGFAKTKLLPYGVYVLKQAKAQAGYAIKSPMDIFIRGTEDPADPPILTINNQAIRYRLKFIKVDAETGNTIAVANTAFKLKDGDGNYVTQTVHYPNEMTIDTFYTDESGEVTLPETVTYGMYYVEELVSPNGYLILTEDLGVFVGDETMNQPGEAYLLEIEIPNEPVKGNIVVEKKGLQLVGFETVTNDYGNEYQHPVYEEGYLAGAVFELYAADAIVGKDGTVWYEQDALVDTITTTANGADASITLPLGKYYLIETSAPEGYAFDSSRHEVELSFADNQTALVESIVPIGNDYLSAEIHLIKEKESLQTVHGNDGTVQQIIITNDPGEGFVFGLYNDKDISYRGGTLMADTLVATGATDADGSLTFSDYYPHGDYYIKELSAPAGWKLNPNTFAVTLDPAAQAEDANVIRVALPEAVHDELIYTTITLTKQDITGESTLPGALIEVKNDNGEVIYRATTDENGQILDIPVTPGKYTFCEILAPDGYALNVAEMTFTVDEYGNVTGDTIIRDDYSRVTLLKQNEVGLPLAGVEFALLKPDGSTLMTAVSNEIGLVTFEKIPFGSYTIVETVPPSGYLKSEISVRLTVDGSFVNPTQPIATVVNCPNEIILHKVNTEGTALQGAAFALLNAYGEQVMAAVSDTNGIVRFTKVPYGDYTLHETQAPDGYNLMEDIHLNVDASWTKPVEYTGVDIPNHYEFIKVDNRGNPLAGAKFLLEDSESDYLRELVSGDDGVVRVTDLNPGSYIIRETEALEGFNKSDETISIVIDEHYVAPAELYRFVNYSGIQTGFEMEMTPVMWGGAAMLVVGVALLVANAKHSKGKAQKRKRNLKQHR